MSNRESARENQTVDFVGMIAGSLCAIHCLVSSTAPVWISLLGIGSLFSHTAEIIFVMFGITTALLTIIFGTYGPSATKVRAILTVGVLALLFAQYLEMNLDHHEHHEDEHHQAHISHNEADSHNTHHSEQDSDEEKHSNIPLVFSVFGGFMIVSGHYFNIRSLRTAQ